MKLKTKFGESKYFMSISLKAEFSASIAKNFSLVSSIANIWKKTRKPYAGSAKLFQICSKNLKNFKFSERRVLLEFLNSLKLIPRT